MKGWHPRYEPGKSDRKCPFTALTGLERHARTPCSEVFSHICRTYRRNRISVSRPQQQGNLRQDGQPCGRNGGNKGQLSYFVEAICRDFRQHDEEEFRKLTKWQKHPCVPLSGANVRMDADECRSFATSKRSDVPTPTKRRFKGHETAYQIAGQYGTPQTLIDAGGRGFRELALETS